jgi:CBS domain-containing protein
MEVSAAVAVPGTAGDPVHSDELSGDPVLQFFHSATAYDIMPENGKVVVVDAQLPLLQVFRIFVEQWTNCAVVWTESSGCTMLLNTTHLIKIILQYTEEVEPAALTEKLGQVTIADWLRSESQGAQTDAAMQSVEPDISLYAAISLMENHSIQRLPVVEKTTTLGSTVLHIITFPRILRYVMAHFHNDNDELLNKSIEELAIGFFNAAEIVTVGTDVNLKEVFELMLARDLHSIPIVDEDGVVVDVISQTDVTLAARSASYECLERPARSLLLEHGSPQESLHTCMRSETLISVLRRLVTTGADRLICIDVPGHLEGVVTLNHIFGHFMQIADGTQEPIDVDEEGGSAVDADEDDGEQFGRFCVTDLES